MTLIGLPKKAALICVLATLVNAQGTTNSSPPQDASTTASSSTGSTTFSPTMTQCPCVKPKGSTACIAYNPQYQASNLQEVITNFYDVTALNPNNAATLNPLAGLPDVATSSSSSTSSSAASQGGTAFPGNPGQFGRPGQQPPMGFVSSEGRYGRPPQDPSQCRDDQCKRCFGHVLNWFKVASEKTGASSAIEEVQEMLQKSGIDHGSPNDCPHFEQFNGGRGPLMTFREEGGPPPPPKPHHHHHGSHGRHSWPGPHDWNHKVDPSSEKNDDHEDHDGKDDSSGDNDNDKKEGSNERRKRETKSIDITDPYQYTMSVDCHTKGAAVEAGSDWCGLCSFCWQIGYLKPEFFPQYVNQMGCGNDTVCLGGNGECRSRLRSLNVLRNYGTIDTPNWQEFSLSIPMSCDCQIKKDSQLINLTKQ